MNKVHDAIQQTRYDELLHNRLSSICVLKGCYGTNTVHAHQVKLSSVELLDILL